MSSNVCNRIFCFFKKQFSNISQKQFMTLLSIPVGIVAALAAIIIKLLAHGIASVSKSIITYSNILYFVMPLVGIFITILVVKYIIRRPVGHGIPGILYAISQNSGQVKPHTMFSSIITSVITVGMGGSVGLEGPSVSTGASLGSNIGRMLKLNHKQIILLIGMGSAAALAAIFKAPITGVVFAMEVLMIDLSLTALVPLIISSFTAIMLSYMLLGKTVEYSVQISEGFIPGNFVYYIILGLFLGLVSAYFLSVSFRCDKFFKKIESPWTRFAIAGTLLGVLIFLFPALYGEGYEAINAALQGDYTFLYRDSIFARWSDSKYVVIFIIVGVIVLKAFATSFTFAAGGVGGTFAPAMFMGAFSGLFFALIVNTLGLGNIDPAKFALVGMGGFVAGMLHAPLSGIFLIAEITNGYSLMVPLMIVSALSYVINRLFFKESIYTRPVAEQGVTLSHNKDVSILNMMAINRLIETNFSTIESSKTLGDLIPLISTSTRNIFPVIDEEGNFKGHVIFDDIRSVIFDNSLYKNSISEYLVYPQYVIDPSDSMESVAEKFKCSGKYNIPVIQNGKYLGYISRANVFSTYRTTMSEMSDE